MIESRDDNVQIGDHHLHDVPKNVSGVIVGSHEEPAYNEAKRFCGYHHFLHVRIGDEVYSLPEHVCCRTR